MKYSTTIIVTEAFDQTQQKIVYQTLCIPALHYQQDINAAERDYINSHTLETYLKTLLHDILEEQEKNGYSIDPPRTIEAVLHLYLSQPSKRSEHGLQLSLTIDYESLFPRSHFFEKFTPWFVGITSILEIILMTVLGFCSMEYAQGTHGLLPMSMNTNIGLSATSSVIGLFWSLWDFFTDGAIISLRDTGATLDKKLQQAWAWLRGKNKSSPMTDYPVNTNRTALITNRALKTFYMISFFNALYGTITGSYTSIMALSDIVAENISIPPNIYRILQYLQLAMGHIDDPFMWSTMIYFNFTIIDAIVNAAFPTRAIEAESILSTTPQQQALQDQQRASRLTRWLNNTDALAYQPLIDAPSASHEAEKVSTSSSSVTPALNRSY